MKYKIITNFRGEINGVIFNDNQDFDYLKDFIEDLEYKYNLSIVDEEITESLKSILYEKTEQLYQEIYKDNYNEAHNEAVSNLLEDIGIKEMLSKHLK